MKSKLLFFYVIPFLFLFQSCGFIEFTHTARNEYETKNISLEKIQYYNSEKIILQRTVEKGEQVNLSTSGKIIAEDGKQIEEIIFEQFTPGICVDTTENYLKIKFEEGDLNYLIFGIGENSNIKNNYGIYGYSWISTEGGYTQYNGKKFKIVEGGNCLLMMKKSDKNTLQKESRNVKGLKVN
jgi:hypothetical protein